MLPTGPLPALVLACAVCGAAQQALPANGVEPAFEGRRRATLDVRAAAFRTREATPRVVAEQRVEPGVAFALGARTMLGVALPVVRRTTGADGATARDEVMLGDAEARASTTANRGIGHHLAFDAGLKLPTAKAARDANGALLPADLQTGCSSLVPFVAVTALWSRGPLAGWLTAAVLLPFSVRPDVPHPGDSIRASANLQVQPARWLALRLGVNGRADTAAAFREELVPSSGGAQVHVAHEVVLSPVSDLVLTFGLAVPVVQEMRAYRVTSPVALASLGFDL